LIKPLAIQSWQLTSTYIPYAYRWGSAWGIYGIYARGIDVSLLFVSSSINRQSQHVFFFSRHPSVYIEGGSIFITRSPEVAAAAVARRGCLLHAYVCLCLSSRIFLLTVD
jgi:hypothetical protein